MESDEICFLGFALLGKLRTFSPQFDRSGGVAAFGYGQIELFSICLLAIGAKQTKLHMLHSHIIAILPNLLLDRWNMHQKMMVDFSFFTDDQTERSVH